MKSDRGKTKDQLIIELNRLRERIAELETPQSASVSATSETSHPGESYLRDLYNNLPQGIVKISTSGQILLSNHAFQTLYGYSAAELSNITIFDLIVPEGRKRTIEYINSQLTEQLPPQSYQCKCLSKDGRIFDVQVDWNYERDSAGKVCGFFTIITEISDRKRVERALLESKEQYRITLDSMADAIHVVDTDMRIRIFNSSFNKWCKDLGLSVDPIGQNLFDFFPFLPDRVWDEYQQVFKTQNTLITEESTPLGDQTIHTETRKIPIFLQGQAKQVLTIVRDVTYRKKAEETLQNSEELLSNILESMQEGILVVDQNFHYTYWNKALERISETSREEVITQDKVVWDLFPHLVENGVDQLIRKAMQGQTIHRSIVSHRLKSGKTSFTSATYLPLKTAQGEIRGIMGIIHDLTERVKTQNQMQLLSSVVDQSMEGVAVADLDGNLFFLNPAFATMHGYPVDELIGKHLSILHTREQMTAVEAANRQIQEKGTFSGEIWHRRADGSVFPAHMHNTLLREETGTPIGMIASMHDVTERKQAEEERLNLEAQVQYAQKLESLGILAGGIAHDFNNILHTILGNVSLALCDLSPVAPARENLHEIEIASRHAAELCRQMLAYSGKEPFQIEPVDLGEIVKEMCHMLETCISKKALLKYHFADNLPAIQADATQIRQIIMNLITNASEALEDRSGVISISTGVKECNRGYLSETYFGKDLPEGLYVHLEVADTGCGMNPQTLQKIFEPFFTTKTTGRGLGLAAVLGIVRSHKGALKVWSEPGKGTTFNVLIPACDLPLSPMKGFPKEATQWKESGTILLVDDDESIRIMGKRMLMKVGFDVLTAKDGEEAVQVVRDHADEIACVLLDLTMPRMNGEEAFLEMRKLRKDIQVILCTGYNEYDVTRHFSLNDLAGFIHKPYTINDLLSLLRKVLRNG